MNGSTVHTFSCFPFAGGTWFTSYIISYVCPNTTPKKSPPKSLREPPKYSRQCASE